MYKYQDIVVLYFTEAKEKLPKATSKILQSIYQCFHQRCRELITNDTKDTYAQETITQGDILLYHICRILNTNAWIIPEGIKTSAAVKKTCISIKRIQSYYKKKKENLKDQLINEIIEKCIQVIEVFVSLIAISLCT